MPRQRSKKLSLGRESAEASTENSAQTFETESLHSESDNDSDEIMDKDEEEEELDRLVLGDGGAFKAQLLQGAAHDGKDDSYSDAGPSGEDEAAEGDLEDVDDADVRMTPRKLPVHEG